MLMKRHRRDLRVETHNGLAPTWFGSVRLDSAEGAFYLRKPYESKPSHIRRVYVAKQA